MFQITLVPDKHDHDVRVCMVPQFLQPPSDVRVCLLLRNIVHKQGTDCAAVVSINDWYVIGSRAKIRNGGAAYAEVIAR